MMAVKKGLRVAGVSLAWVGVVCASPNLQEGKWESTVRIEMSGAAFPIPLATSKKCMTANDMIPNTVKEGQKCEIPEKKIVGDEVTWRVHCEQGKGVTDGVARIKYFGDRYEGRMDVTISEPSEQRRMNMVYLMTGKRIGACE